MAVIIDGGSATVNVDDKANKVTGATASNLASLTVTGDLADSGYNVLDQDDLLSNSDTSIATQQSIKAYVDANAGAGDVGDLTTTGLAPTNYLRIANPGGLEERTPAQTLSDIGAETAGAAAAVQSNLTSHTGNTSNPHSVTAAQVLALPLAGGTLTGNLGIGVSPVYPLHISQTTADLAAKSLTKNSGLNWSGGPYFAVAQSDGSNEYGLSVQFYNQAGAKIIRLTSTATTAQLQGAWVANSSFSGQYLGGGAGGGIYQSTYRTSFTGIAGVERSNSYLSSIRRPLAVGHLSIGAAALAGMGAGIVFETVSSTGAIKETAYIDSSMADPTNATFTTDLVFKAIDYGGEREGLRIRANGATAAISLFGATPQPQSTGWEVTNVTADKTFDANSTSIDELADVLGTLITYLLARGDLAA